MTGRAWVPWSNGGDGGDGGDRTGAPGVNGPSGVSGAPTEELDAVRLPLLECRGVDVAYERVQVLFGVDLSVDEGEIVALLGTNGAGKSTLLRAVSGLIDPMGGTIRFGARDITHADAVTTTELGIVQVPGGKAVFPTLTVADHFRAATWMEHRDRVDSTERVERAIDAFPRLRERWRQPAGNLSGGEQQQLGLAMAFVARPRLLLIDELSIGLAPAVVDQLLGMVRSIHAEGATVILVEQSVNLALTIAQRAFFMEKGEVRFSGATAELLERDDLLRSVFLEGASTASAAGGRPGGGAGTRAKNLVPRPPAAPAAPDAAAAAAAGRAGEPGASEEPALEVVGLSKRFGGIAAVDGVSFSVPRGCILGLIGPNGAGKTTVFDLVSGVLSADGGTVVLGGVDVTDWSAPRRAGAGLGRSFQDARLFPSLTVAENVALGLERHLETRDQLASLLGLPAVREAEEDVALSVDRLIELMGLQAFRDKFVSELSTGTRRIVDLTMTLAHDPAVVLLDEPSSGIAQRETEALGPLLRRIRDELGCAVLLIEHDMPLITSLADEMLALDLGRVIAAGTPAAVVEHPDVVASYLGTGRGQALAAVAGSATDGRS
jgi:ABC-type branched-subunit amino acid transport system ATPase component